MNKHCTIKTEYIAPFATEGDAFHKVSHQAYTDLVTKITHLRKFEDSPDSSVKKVFVFIVVVSQGKVLLYGDKFGVLFGGDVEQEDTDFLESALRHFRKDTAYQCDVKVTNLGILSGREYVGPVFMFTGDLPMIVRENPDALADNLRFTPLSDAIKKVSSMAVAEGLVLSYAYATSRSANI